MHNWNYSGQHRVSFSSLLYNRLMSKFLIKRVNFASANVKFGA